MQASVCTFKTAGQDKAYSYWETRQLQHRFRPRRYPSACHLYNNQYHSITWLSSANHRNSDINLTPTARPTRRTSSRTTTWLPDNQLPVDIQPVTMNPALYSPTNWPPSEHWQTDRLNNQLTNQHYFITVLIWLVAFANFFVDSCN